MSSQIMREQDVTVTALQPCENQMNAWWVVRMWVDSEGENKSNMDFSHSRR